MTNLRPDLPDDASVRNGTPLSSHDHPRNDVASSVRDVIHTLVTKEIPDEVLEAEAVVIAESADRLRDAVIEGKRPRDTSPVITDHPQDFFPFGPTTGRANPMALPNGGPPASCRRSEAEGIFVVVPHERMIDNAERHSARVAQERTES